MMMIRADCGWQDGLAAHYSVLRNESCIMEGRDLLLRVLVPVSNLPIRVPSGRHLGAIRYHVAQLGVWFAAGPVKLLGICHVPCRITS
jgi:hypothetical protein